MLAYLGNELMDEYQANYPVLLERNNLDIIPNGLVFDFRAEDYQSGSLTWPSKIGNYSGSVTGSTSGSLEKLDDAVGFDGTKWLVFDNAMTASISSSAWEVYALVNLASTSSDAYTPTFFAKGIDAPGWYYSYRGGTGVGAGYGYINWQGGSLPNGGLVTDSLNIAVRSLQGVFPNIPQQFVFSYPSSSTFPAGPYTLNWYGNTSGNTVIGDTANISPLSFSGSAASKLTFGLGVDSWINYSGSVVRLYAYNRILTLQERKRNWFILTGQYIP